MNWRRFLDPLADPAQKRAWQPCCVYLLMVAAVFIVLGVFIVRANHNARVNERPAVERTK